MLQVIFEVSHFEEDGTQDYLVLKSMYLKKILAFVMVVIFNFGNLKQSWWNIKRPNTSNHSIPELSYFGTKTRVKFNGICLKQYKVTFTHGTIDHK